MEIHRKSIGNSMQESAEWLYSYFFTIWALPEWVCSGWPQNPHALSRLVFYTAWALPEWVRRRGLQLSVGGLPPDILQYLSSPRVSLQIRSGLRSKSVRHISVRIHTHLQTIPATPTVLLQAFRCVSCLPGSKMKHGCPKRKAYHMWGSPGRVIINVNMINNMNIHINMHITINEY